jgi:hypothetical protein
MGDLLFWAVARSQLPYSVFVIGMLVSGCGAGLLNGQTVKVLSGSVPQDRAGMASALASTTRFIGILVSVAGMGAVLTNVIRHTFGSVAHAAGLSPVDAMAAARRVAAGDLSGMLDQVTLAARTALQAAGLASFADGFAAASLLASGVAVIACLLTFHFIRSEDTAPSGAMGHRSCKLIDCRDPL